MANDKREMIYWLEQERRQMRLVAAGVACPPLPGLAGSTLSIASLFEEPHTTVGAAAPGNAAQEQSWPYIT